VRRLATSIPFGLFLAASVFAQDPSTRPSGRIADPPLFPDVPIPASRPAPDVEPIPSERGRGFDADAGRLSRDLAKRTQAATPTPEGQREGTAIVILVGTVALFVFALGAYLRGRRRG